MENSPETRLSLIGRLRDQENEAAWAEFLQIYEPLICTIVKRRGLQHADAVDVTQDVLARVANSIERWDPDPQKGAFRGWLYRVTRNLTIDFLRRRQKRSVFDGENQVDFDQVPRPSEDESNEFRLEYERRLFAWAGTQVKPTVKPETWMAFWQTTIEEKPIADVAQELKMKRGAVYVARSRVMSKIVAIINKRLDETANIE